MQACPKSLLASGIKTICCWRVPGENVCLVKSFTSFLAPQGAQNARVTLIGGKSCCAGLWAGRKLGDWRRSPEGATPFVRIRAHQRVLRGKIMGSPWGDGKTLASSCADWRMFAPPADLIRPSRARSSCKWIAPLCFRC